MGIEEDEGNMRNIDKKVESIDCGDERILMMLREILVRNKSLLRECPGRIEGYAHEFQVSSIPDTVLPERMASTTSVQREGG